MVVQVMTEDTAFGDRNCHLHLSNFQSFALLTPHLKPKGTTDLSLLPIPLEGVMETKETGPLFP